MRSIARYFAAGAKLGSVAGLIVLVLIWAWFTLHLGAWGLRWDGFPPPWSAP